MSHEFYQPSKESRDIRRDQAQHAQENGDGTMKEVRLGFTKSYTETAKPGDTLRRMIKRAYKDGKLYSERQANEAADRVIALFSPENITRVKHGDRITFRNDLIIFRFFEPQEDREGKRDVEFPLNASETSLRIEQRRELAEASSDERAALSEGPAEAVAGTGASQRPATQAEISDQLLAQQRREVLRAFIADIKDLKYITSNKAPDTVTAMIRRKIKSSDSRIPTKFRTYEFSEIVCIVGEEIAPTHYLIGLDSQTGEVVLFNPSEPSKVVRINVNKPSDLQILRAALFVLVKAKLAKAELAKAKLSKTK